MARLHLDGLSLLGSSLVSFIESLTISAPTLSDTEVWCQLPVKRPDPLRCRSGRFSVEPPVRIELTTFRLQGECSTTELRRREAGVSLSAHSSRASRTSRSSMPADGRAGGVERRDRRRGMRSVMLLSEATILLSESTASCRGGRSWLG